MHLGFVFESLFAHCPYFLEGHTGSTSSIDPAPVTKFWPQ